MPLDFVNDPRHWLDRAEEMRMLAEQMTEAEAKAIMLRLAADYELLAQRAAARADGRSADSTARRPGEPRTRSPKSK
jgi:hypothetical protein